jgi:FkbM family methyltransferase
MTGFYSGISPDQIQTLQNQMNWLQEQVTTTRARVCALEARELLDKAGKREQLPVEFRSQFGEDVWIWDLLGRSLEGFFIEVGAFDGYHYSVSYALEAMGWRGLLIEALPGPYEACRARRMNSRVVHSALARRGSPATMEFVNVQDQYGGMLSYLGSPKSTADHAKIIEQQGFQKQRISVPVTTMNALLESYTPSPPARIDAAVIDVEGAEVDLLDGFDLKKWKPSVLMLEDNTGREDSPLGRYMQSQPYGQIAWVGVNRVYIHEEQQGLLENVRRF